MNSLHKDLIERRLWPLVAVLIVAIIAVPLLLLHGGGATASAVAVPPVPAAAPAAPAALPRTGEPVSEALHDSVALRDPFASNVAHLTSSAPSQITSGSSSRSGTSATAGASGTGSGAGSTAPASSSGGSAGGPTQTVTTVVTQTVTMPAAAAPTQWTLYRTDVSVVNAGKTAVLANLPRLAPLPSAGTPKAMFSGVAGNGKDAIFQLADGVTALGPGLCRPVQADCRAIVLAVGATELLDYTDATGQTQTIKLSVTHISASVTHSRKVAEAAFNHYSTSGACELLLANPTVTQLQNGALTTTALIPQYCVTSNALVPFPGIGGA